MSYWGIAIIIYYVGQTVFRRPFFVLWSFGRASEYILESLWSLWWGRVFPTVYFRNWWHDFITAKTRIYCPNIFIVLVAALLIGRRGRDTGQFICVIGCPPELDAHQSGLNWIRVFKTDTSICRLRKWSERGVMAPAIYLQSATRGMNVCLSVTQYRASFKVFLANGMLQQINRLV